MHPRCSALSRFSQYALQVLINNAAAPISAQLNRIAEGFQAQFGSDNLDHFLFASLLMPSILCISEQVSTSHARVVQISSSAQAVCDIRYKDPTWQLFSEEYTKWLAYGQTKTANILFARSSRGVIARCDLGVFRLYFFRVPMLLSSPNVFQQSEIL